MLALISIDEGRVLTECCQLEIEVIAIKLRLYGISSQTQQILLELLILLVLPILVDILLVEVIFLWWNEWSLQFAVP